MLWSIYRWIIAKKLRQLKLYELIYPKTEFHHKLIEQNSKRKKRLQIYLFF